MGDEYLETECKLLKITLDKMMTTNDLIKLRCMFTHAEERLELIFRTRYKKLLDKEIAKITLDYLNNDFITVEKEVNNETSDS